MLSDRTVTRGPACVPTTTLAPAVPAAGHRQSCLRGQLLPADRVQGREADGVSGLFVNFSPFQTPG